MSLTSLTDPDEIKAQGQLLGIYQKQRREANGRVSHEDLMNEADIVIRLLELSQRVILNKMENEVRISNERQG